MCISCSLAPSNLKFPSSSTLIPLLSCVRCWVSFPRVSSRSCGRFAAILHIRCWVSNSRVSSRSCAMFAAILRACGHVFSFVTLHAMCIRVTGDLMQIPLRHARTKLFHSAPVMDLSTNLSHNAVIWASSSIVSGSIVFRRTTRVSESRAPAVDFDVNSP